MRTVGTIVKAAIGIVALVYFGGASSLLEGFMAFALVYGLISYYAWYFTSNDTSFTLFFGGSQGLVMSAISLVFWLAGPILAILFLYLILGAILPGEIGAYIVSGGIAIACVGCVISDIIHIVRLFKPDFLKGLEDLSEAAEDAGND